jgi:small-conductance mechanosensitive channel
MRDFGEVFGGTAATLVDRLTAYLPSIVAATLLLLVGWLLARLLKLLAVRAVLLIDTVLPRLGLPATVSRVRAGRSATVVGAIVFWAVLLAFAAAATQVLGLQAFTDWLARLVEYLPTLVVGVLIVAVGWVLSAFAAELVQATALRLEPGQRRVLARVVRVSILAAAILIGADQLGVRITFLAIFVGAVALTVGGGVALAVGLGAREHVANLVAAQHLRQAYSVGQVLRVGEHEGRLLEVTATGFVLESAEGRTVLPARMLATQPVTVMSKGPGG